LPGLFFLGVILGVLVSPVTKPLVASMSTPSPEDFYSDLCPSCGRPMTHVRTIWRGLEPSSEVLECRKCGVTLTQKAGNGTDKPKPPGPTR
jgi:hypothetical protein